MYEPDLIAELLGELSPGLRLQKLVAMIRSRFNCDTVALLRMESDSLRPEAAVGLVHETLGRRFRIDQHPRLATLLAQKQALRFDPESGLADPYDGLLESCVGESLPVHDCMGISLYVNQQLWGVLTLDALQPGTFTEISLAELTDYARLTEAAVRINLLEQDSRQLAALNQRAAVKSSLSPEQNEILGRSPAISDLLNELNVVASSDLPVLLTGETGVGKELFARRLHSLSNRQLAPLVHVNCAALPEALAETELFGHVKGAYSGATSNRAGRVEAANGGSLFLDEVGELPLSVQAKLLRTLQNGEIQRLGEDKPIQVDVRIIAATNRDLKKRVADGSFRPDLYHRLSVYPIPIPPLRERGNDVLILAGHYLELNRSRLGIRSLRLSASAEQAVLAYSWPGNVRELEHAISRAALKAISRGAQRNSIVSLDASLLDLEQIETPQLTTTKSHGSKASRDTHQAMPLKLSVERCQRDNIQSALRQHSGSWAAAARTLSLDASNLHKLAKKLGIK